MNTTDKYKLIVCLYVNNMIMTRNNEVEMTCFKRNTVNHIEVFDLGNLTYILGIEFETKS